jgi:hypothetical protein
MNKTILIAIALLVLLGLGYGAYSLTRNNSNDNNQDNNNSDDSGSLLEDIFAAGGNYSCSYSATDATNGFAQAEIFVTDSGAKYYSEFTARQEGEDDVKTYMIKDQNYAYTWTSESDEGYKYTLTDEDEGNLYPASDDFSNSNSGLEAAFGYTYDCDPWSVDNSKFNLPDDVEFIDVQKQIDEATQQACEACEGLPAGESRNSCLESLSCN